MTPTARAALRRVHAAECRAWTDPSQRHVRLIATNLLRYGRDVIVAEEPEHAALSLLAVVENLLRAREREARWATRCPEIAQELAEERKRVLEGMTAGMGAMRLYGAVTGVQGAHAEDHAHDIG